MRTSIVRELALHVGGLIGGYVLVCAYAVGVVAQPAAFLVGAAGLFTAAASATLRYDVDGWALPAGVDSADLRRRRELGVALGAGAAACAGLSLSAPLLCQVILMAAAAVNDFARFRLPLPLTIVGSAGAIIAAALRAPGELPSMLAFAALLPLLMRLLRFDLGGGDVLAAGWIMLAAPWHGPTAILLGHVVLMIVMRLADPNRAVRRAPLGGAWLMAAAWVTALSWTWGVA